MPTFVVTDPDTGTKLRLTGDAPPTELELEQIFAQQVEPKVQQPVPEGGTLQAITAPVKAVAGGVASEVIPGIAGAVSAPFVGGERAGQIVRDIQAPIQEFTAPETQAGQESLAAIGGAAESLTDIARVPAAATSFVRELALSGGDVGAAQDAFKKTKDIGPFKEFSELTFEATGSPTLAAAMDTLPVAIGEAIGLGAGRRIAQAKTGLKSAPKKIPSPTKPKQGAVSRAIVESAPEIDQLKQVSRGIYQEIGDLGVTLQPKAHDRFVRKVLGTAKKARVNKNRTPKAFGAAQEFAKELSRKGDKSILDIDDLRAVAQDAASSIDPADARIGMLMLDDIDNFLDTVPSTAFRGKNAKAASKVGERYKAARNLWGRARRAELLQDAFTKAERQATGLENGLRTQLRQIVNNKKRSRFFTKDELSAMDDVIRGTGKQNALKLVGRLGVSEGGATNILGGLGGTAILGPGAPVVGQISRKLAQRATKKGFDIAEAITRAGPDGRKVTEAYLQVTPKAERSISELSDLLASPGVDLSDLLDSADKVVKESAEIARGRRAFNTAEIAGAAAPAAIQQEEQ